MKILITVEGEKVKVEIDSNQLELPLKYDTLLPPVTLEKSENIKENEDGTLSKIDPTRPASLTTKPIDFSKGFSPKKLGRPPKTKSIDRSPINSEFKPIVPGTPEYGPATRNDAEEGRKKLRSNPDDIDEG